MKKILKERPEIDFGEQLLNRKHFDTDISVFNKLKQIIENILPFNDSKIEVAYYDLFNNGEYKKIQLYISNIRLKNPSSQIIDAVKNRNIEACTSICRLVIVDNLIPYIINSIKKIDDSEYNGSIFKNLKLHFEEFDILNEVSRGFANYSGSAIKFNINSDSIYIHTQFNLLVNVENIKDKFSKYIDTGQELIDFNESRKPKFDDEIKYKILKNAGLLKNA